MAGVPLDAPPRTPGLPMTTDTNLTVDGRNHDSDCATHNMPAMQNGPCDCALSKRSAMTPTAPEVDLDEIVTCGARALCKATGLFPDGFRENSIYNFGLREEWQNNAKIAARAVIEAALPAIRRLTAEREEVVTDLRWIAEIADKNYEQDEKLRSQGARTLIRISDRAGSALSRLTKTPEVK